MPKFECIAGCTDCCGPVPASREEIKQAPKLAQSVDLVEALVGAEALGWCATCPYARPGHGCAIYEDRPFICRLFGYSEAPELTCAHGRGSSKKLSVQQTARLTHRYVKLIEAVPERRAAQAKMDAIMKERHKTDHL